MSLTRMQRALIADETRYRARTYGFWVAVKRQRRRRAAFGISFLTVAVTLVVLRIGGYL